MHDYYQLLGVPRASTTSQLRRAIDAKRAEAAGPLSKPAEMNTSLAWLDEAEQTLLNPTRRATYDREFREHRNSTPPLLPPPLPVSLPKPILATCSTCKSPIPPQTLFCPSCGSPSQNGPPPLAQEPPPPGPTENSQIAPVDLKRRSPFVRSRIRGTVTMVDSHEVKKARTISWLLKIAIIGVIAVAVIRVLLPKLFVIFLVVVVIAFLIKSPGMIFQILSMPLTLLGRTGLPKMGERTVRITDLRLRQTDGSEVHVRIEGEIVVGSISPGDDIEVTGHFWGGSLRFSKGLNLRTRSELRRRIFA